MSLIPGTLPYHNPQVDCCTRHRAFVQKYDDEEDYDNEDNLVINNHLDIVIVIIKPYYSRQLNGHDHAKVSMIIVDS